MSSLVKNKCSTVKVSPIGQYWPNRVNVVLGELTRNCRSKNLQSTHFALPQLPMTVNHQYDHVTHFAKGGKRYQSKKLKPEVFQFRALVQETMLEDCKGWQPTGVVAAVVVFESPIWLTQTNQPRKVDSDNRLKPLFDAIEKTTLIPDETNWELYVFKAFANYERTLVYLFDLGNMIEFHTEDGE